MDKNAAIVVKVGGSLYDLPDLGMRLRKFLTNLDSPRVFLVPGGGPTADVIRAFDATHHLGEEVSHWLALRALSVNAYFLAAFLPGVPVIEEPRPDTTGWAVIDMHAFARADDARPGHLPHHWTVTSDSLAVRVAEFIQARRVILLKSVTIPETMSWEEANRRGWVDGYFATVAARYPQVAAVNLRTP